MHEPKDKASPLAKTFNAKNVLEPVVENKYTTIETVAKQQKHVRGRLIETDAVKIIETLRSDSGTGPDMLPSRVLKMCAKILASPALWLFERILETGE